MNTKDNPARRLHSFLVLATSIKPHVDSKNALMSIFKLTGQDNVVLRRKMIRLEETFNVVIEMVENVLPKGAVSCWHIQKQLNTAFLNLSLQGSWGKFIDPIDQHVIDGLLSISTIMDFHPNDYHLHSENLSNEQLQSLKDQANKLLEDVVSSDFPEDLKIFIVSHVRKILEAIDDYRISGAMPIIENIEGVFGHVGLRAYQDDSYKGKLLSSGLGPIIRDSVGVMANTIQIVTGYPHLKTALGLFLGVAAS